LRANNRVIFHRLFVSVVTRLAVGGALCGQCYRRFTDVSAAAAEAKTPTATTWRRDFAAFLAV